MMGVRTRPGLVLLAAVCAAAACGTNDPASFTDPVGTPGPPGTTTPGTTPPGTTPPAGTTPPTSTIPPTTAPSTAGPVDVTPRPGPVPTTGRAADLPYPAGTRLGVVGVAHDDVLNVRAGPGAGFPVTARLAPLTTDVETTGRGWNPGGSIWAEVRSGGSTGWVSLRFVAGLDGTEDATAGVVQVLGERPTAPTMAALGRTVAEALASSDPPSTIVMSVPPSTGDLGEVTYDVLGFADDSVAGARLHVFGEPTASGFALRSVEATWLCARGATPDGGLCP